MKTYTIIKERAKKAGISLRQLCIRTGISRETLENWKRQEPRTLLFLERFNEELANAEERAYTKMIDNTLNKTK